MTVAAAAAALSQDGRVQDVQSCAICGFLTTVLEEQDPVFNGASKKIAPAAAAVAAAAAEVLRLGGCGKTF